MGKTGANVSIVFVPRPSPGSSLEAIEAKIGLVITVGVPVQDSAEFWAAAKASWTGAASTPHHRPNCPGSSPPEVPGQYYPANITGKGKIGLVSSRYLTYQLMYGLSDIGFTTAIGIGGDPITAPPHRRSGSFRS